MRNEDNNRKRVQLHPEGGRDNQYNGGHDGRGHFHAKADEGEVVFVLDLVGNKYEIAGVDFFDDPDGQLSYRPNPIPPGTTSVQIHDINTKGMNARYRINVRAQDGRVIACDPMISNEPRGR